MTVSRAGRGRWRPRARRRHGPGASSARRANGSTLVASTTVRRPRARRRSRSRWSLAKAARVARLIRLVARDHRPVPVRREDLVRGEVARREGGLAGTGGTDEDDEARVRDDDLHGSMMRHPTPARCGQPTRRPAGPRSRRLRPPGPHRRAGRTGPVPAEATIGHAGSATRATGTRCSRRRRCPAPAGRRHASRPRGPRGWSSPTRTRTRSLMPALALVGVASGSVARSATSPMSSRIHFVPAPRNACRLTMFPKT